MRSGRDYEYVRNAHNLYLERLGELGMVGFVPVLWRLASVLYPALRARWHPATPA